MQISEERRRGTTPAAVIPQDSPEVNRLRRTYDGYTKDPAIQARRSQNNVSNRLLSNERTAAMRRILDQRNLIQQDKTVLDVGCGCGHELVRLLEWGMRPANLYGVDLLGERIAAARRLYPNLHFDEANAERLDYPDASFDLVLVFTVFSSILSRSMTKNVARELARVLKPAGAILCYDFRYPNPFNRNVRAFTLSELCKLFPGFSARSQYLSVLPPWFAH